MPEHKRPFVEYGVAAEMDCRTPMELLEDGDWEQLMQFRESLDDTQLSSLSRMYSRIHSRTGDENAQTLAALFFRSV